MNCSIYFMVYLMTCCVGFVFASSSDDDNENNNELLLPNSCKDLSNGYHWLKLIDSDEYPAVYQQCNNGYMILDYSIDNNIEKYFDSWQQWHLHTVGPTNDYSINWQQWYLPDTSQEGPASLGYDATDYAFREDQSEEFYYTGTSGFESDIINYLISPDCQSCDIDNTRQLYDTSSTYWMTGTLFGCSWIVKATYKCNVDLLSDTCYVCHEDHSELSDTDRTPISDDSVSHDFEATGVCPHSVQASNNHVVPYHDQCTLDQSGDLKHLKPSLGVTGKYCVCVQPKEDTQFFNIEASIVEESYKNLLLNNENNKKDNFILKNNKDGSLNSESDLENDDMGNNNEDDEEENSRNHVKLYQKDFDSGTYRIKEAGKYILMEDIYFDFKSNEDEPNIDGSYWPTTDDNLNDEYPGAGDVRGAYFMGYFAGITIECNDVEINLNGHSLQMSEYFYYQQRWFTIIELTTQYFLPGQGIGNFGASPSMANNVVIKNGILGLTSHHGIHGNYNKYVKLQDLVVRDFETHGIQFNGFYDVALTNVEVGPTSERVRFNGEYGHMRAMLPRYRTLCEELDEEEDRVLFWGRTESLSMCDIADEIELEMDIAFDYITKGTTYTIEDGESLYHSYLSSLDLFVNQNEKSVPYGSAQFGIFLNTFDASVLTYSLYTPFVSEKAVLDNVKIHDMSHSMREYIRIQRPSSGDFVMNPFAGPLNAEEMIQGFDRNNKYSVDRSKLRYKGNIMLDGYIAMNYLSDNWGFLQMQIVGNNFVVPWAMGTNMDRLNQNSMSFGCNMDVMIHSGKGINGLRLDGVKNVHISNIEIYNLFEMTPLGTDFCGEYDGSMAETSEDAGHFRQTVPMQIGFSGNMNQAININSATEIVIENANIYNLHSETGPVYGISIWPSCEVELKGDILISNMVAGKSVEHDSLSYDDLPNRAPELCGIRVYESYDDGDTVYETTVTYAEINNIKTDCIDGHVGCFGASDLQSVDAATMIGSFDSDTSQCSQEVLESLNKRSSNSLNSAKTVHNINNNNSGHNGEKPLFLFFDGHISLFFVLFLLATIIGLLIVCKIGSLGKLCSGSFYSAKQFFSKDNFGYTVIDDNYYTETTTEPVPVIV